MSVRTSQPTSSPRTTPSVAPTLDDVRHGRGVMELGQHGQGVRKLQTLMNDVFEHQHVAVDGTFGKQMKDRLATFQDKNDLLETGKLNKATLAKLEAQTSNRSRGDYAKTLAQVNPMDPKYLPHSGSTFCNVFAEDVTAKMGAPLPRMMANDLYNWLGGSGGRNAGWKPVSAAEAQRMANQGQPTVAVYHNDSGIHGHIAMVRPGSMAGAGNPAIAQAGAHNFLHGHLRDGFGSLPVRYYTHA